MTDPCLCGDPECGRCVPTPDTRDLGPDPVVCPDCGGEGRMGKPSGRFHDCPTCQGRGEVAP